MIFFVDRDLGSKIFPGILESAGLQVERHYDHFAPDAPDQEWLPAVARLGWIILTNDQRILRRPVEIDSIMASDAAVLVLIGGNAPADQLARNFLNTLDRISEFVARTPAPFIAKVYRPSGAPLSVAEGKAGRVDLKLPQPS